MAKNLFSRKERTVQYLWNSSKSMLGGTLIGFFRDGCCNTNFDFGSHMFV